jgi:hypothetical protein
MKLPQAGAIDCDIHPALASLDDLKPYLSRDWWDYLHTYGLRARHGFVAGTPYPKIAPLATRAPRHCADRLCRRDRLTRDHVKPLSRGGTNSWDNVVTACTKCNARKGNRLPMECGMYPKSTPKEPRYVVMVWYSRGLNEVQRRYVEQFYGEGSLATT